MNLWRFDNLPAWAVAATLVAHFMAGLLLGFVYFRAVWWNTRLFTRGGRAGIAIAVIIGRIVLLGGLLALASREGALPLLTMALGVLTARPMVMRKLLRRSVP